MKDPRQWEAGGRLLNVAVMEAVFGGVAGVEGYRCEVAVA